MSLHNTTESFGITAKIFHWLIAVAIIGVWFAGNFMGDITDAPLRSTVYGLHKSTGIVILALAVLAFSWRAFSIKPGLPAHVKPWQKAAATGVKYALYLCMIFMPLSGWAMSSAGGRPVSVYGLFTLPELVARDDVMRYFYGSIHDMFGNLLWMLVLAHVGAAMLHHFYYKDGVLKRMLP